MARKPRQVAPPPNDEKVSAAGMESSLDYETVSRLAYSYWEARGRPYGSPEDDWFRATSELSGRNLPPKKSKTAGAA